MNRLRFLYIDTMRDYIWTFYHKWILHRGRYYYREQLSCDHMNPYDILTPKLLKEQADRLWESGR